MCRKSVLLTWEHGEGVSDGRHVDPSLVVFLHAGRTLLPVGIVLALVRGTDEESSNIILGGNDQEAVVGVTPDATARLTLPVCLVGGWESVVLVSHHPLSSDGVASGLTAVFSCGAIHLACIAVGNPWEHPSPAQSRQGVSLQSHRDSSCKTSWGLAFLRQAKGRVHGMATS